MMKVKKGFTLIELMLAMLYVALLLVTIATLIMHVMDSYKKGMAIKEVNINARSIIDDITRTVANAPPIGKLEAGNIDKDTGEWKYSDTSAIYGPTFTIAGQTVAASSTTWYREFRTTGTGNPIDGGILCTGNYSYVWKHADRLPSDWRFGQGSGATADGSGDTGNLAVDGRKDFRLMKVRDASRKACTASSTGVLETSLNWAVFGESFVELITNNEMDLALYDFKVFTPATSSSNGQTFYGFSFILGTIRGIDRSGGIISNESCIPPQAREETSGEHIGFDFSYCSINKFNFSARSSGTVLTKGS
jgi:type II secretory pathway pseudopilin PulG